MPKNRRRRQQQQTKVRKNKIDLEIVASADLFSVSIISIFAIVYFLLRIFFLLFFLQSFIGID